MSFFAQADAQKALQEQRSRELWEDAVAAKQKELQAVRDRVEEEKLAATMAANRAYRAADYTDKFDPGPVPDPVNHPPHYNKHPSGVECITVTEHFNFNLGNAIKYIWRAGEKGDALEDLRKARWYLDREVGRLEGRKP
jgi:hypothetical protein